ncbi:hypothetical protein V495_08273, partial [Pseudogymnoascus sp. VKM F-4514 (FW-929)]
MSQFANLGVVCRRAAVVGRGARPVTRMGSMVVGGRRGMASAPVDDGKLPLKGIRVLDMTRVLAGPYCTQILGDLGAEVIKVEHPIRGDDTRAWGPPYAPYTAESGREGPGESAYYLSVNRNKKSLALSFQHPSGVAALHKLLPTIDILVENYLPNTLAKYKLDYATLSAINPSLIYASITGYGQTGPYAPRAGYDVMVEAEMGLMHITGSRDGPPVKVGVAVTDLTTGLYTSNAIMAALIARGRTGRGQHIDSALSDCQVATLSNLASSSLVSGQRDSGRWGTAHPSIVPYRAFATKDGEFLVGGGNDRLFGVLCQGLGKAEWAGDERFRTNADRVANRGVLEGMIEEVTRERSTQEWLEAFEGSGLPYAAVNDVRDTLDHAHVRARDMVVKVEHGACGEVEMVNTPVKYSEAEPGIRTAPPLLGEHTDEVLGEMLGMSAEEIEAMRKEGARSPTRRTASVHTEKKASADLHFDRPEAYYDIYNSANHWDKEPTQYHSFGLDHSCFGSLKYAQAKERKDVLLPMFSRQAVTKLQSIVQNNIDRLCDALEANDAAGKPSDLFYGLRCFSLDTILQYAFNLSIDALGAPDFKAPAVEAMEASLPASIVYRNFPLLRQFVHSLPDWISILLSPATAGMVRLRAVLGRQVKQAIENRESLDDSPHETMYHHLLNNQANKLKIPDAARLYDEAQALVFAAAHPTANALTVGVFHILSNPDIKERLVRELREGWPDLKKTPTFEELERLPYLTSVITESLRMSPGVAAPLLRITPFGGAMIGGVKVPSRVTVGMTGSFAHSSSHLFPSASTFDPSRWLGDDAAQLERWLVPFSKGPR